MLARDDSVSLGRISGLHGVRGWVKVFSYTDPMPGIFEYDPWLLEHNGQQRVFKLLDGRRQGNGLIARLAGLADRDEAANWVGATIAVERQSLPPTADNEYYWTDLIGLSVATVEGQPLGTVKRLLETGANDVLVVAGDRERLIPWLPQKVVMNVDLKAGCIQVDWDPEF